MTYSSDDMETCLSVLQVIADSPQDNPTSQRFNSLISKVSREAKRSRLKAEQLSNLNVDRGIKAACSMIQLQRNVLTESGHTLQGGSEQEIFVGTLTNPGSCYICKAKYRKVHFFYHLLCPECAAFNYGMRYLRADLRGRTALITGGRVKIGFQIVLRLLRDGARVIVTTRFPFAAAKRFYDEPDSADWVDRLNIFGLDLRNLSSVDRFAEYLLTHEPSIDIVIHNAAQTVRRPKGFYQDMIEQEAHPEGGMTSEARRLVIMGAPATVGVYDCTMIQNTPPLPQIGNSKSLQVLSNLLESELFRPDILPINDMEDNEEVADSRDRNSWLLRLDEVGVPEMLEVQLVNSMAPFVLNSRLKPLMKRSPFSKRFIVNVSAMEGQFARHKTVFHPHTNMAKAALNMMTRTSSEDYAQGGIYMNSVDTGWVTDENPAPKRTVIQEELGFYPPLDIVDGMARVYHPVALGITGPDEPLFGKFLKNYAPCPW